MIVGGYSENWRELLSPREPWAQSPARLGVEEMPLPGRIEWQKLLGVRVGIGKLEVTVSRTRRKWAGNFKALAPNARPQLERK